MRYEDEIIIKASHDAIYKLLSKSQNFHKLVPEIKVDILETEEDHLISNWQITTEKDEVFKWKQRENFDPELMTIDYALIEGDWSTYHVRFKIAELDDESEIFFQAEAATEIKGFKSYLEMPFFRKQLHAFCKEFIQAVRDKLELSHGQSY